MTTTARKPRRRLALTRKVDESVDIMLAGKRAVLTIKKIGRNRITCWIEADDDVKILRSELVPFVPAAPTAGPETRSVSKGTML